MRKLLLVSCTFFVGYADVGLVGAEPFLQTLPPIEGQTVTRATSRDLRNIAVMSQPASSSTIKSYLWNGDGYRHLTTSVGSDGYWAEAVSNGGDVALLSGVNAGGSFTPGGYALRWENGNTTEIGKFDENGNSTISSGLYDLSLDKTIMAGVYFFQNPVTQYMASKAALFNVDGSVHALTDYAGTPHYDSRSEARAISADGTRVVGQSLGYAAVWTDINAAPVIMGDDGVYTEGSLLGISNDGRYATGRTSYAGQFGSYPIMWSQDNGFKLIDLPFMHNGGMGTVVSNSGAVGGYVMSQAITQVQRAFYYSQNTGGVYLDNYLISQGVNLTDFVYLMSVDGISDNGEILIGTALSREGLGVPYIASLNGDIPGVSTPGDIINGAGSLNMAGQQTRSILSNHMTQSLFVARNAMSYFLTPDTGLGGSADDLADIEPAAGGIDFRGRMSKSDISAYMVGSFGWGQGGQGGRNYDDHVYSGAVGVLYKVTDEAVVGVGYVASRDRQNTFLDGHVIVKGQGGSALYAYEPKMGLRLYTAFTAMHLDMEAKRHYRSGARTVSSNGDTSGYALGGIVRAGYAMYPWQDDRWQLMPYVEGEYSHVKLKGYKEKSGPFPATMKDQSGDTYISRLGGQITYYMTPDLTLRGRAAWGHLYGDQDDLQASIASMSISMPHAGGTRNWVEVGGSALWAVTERANIGVDVTGVTGRTAEPAINVMLGLNYKF